MTGRQILLDARMWFALGNMEYRRKFPTKRAAILAHNRSYKAAARLGYSIIRKRGERGYRFSHDGCYLCIYYIMV